MIVCIVLCMIVYVVLCMIVHTFLCIDMCMIVLGRTELEGWVVVYNQYVVIVHTMCTDAHAQHAHTHTHTTMASSPCVCVTQAPSLL